MSNTYNSYKSLDDLPEKLEVRDDFKEIYNVMEHSSQNMFITGKACLLYTSPSPRDS